MALVWIITPSGPQVSGMARTYVLAMVECGIVLMLYSKTRAMQTYCNTQTMAWKLHDTLYYTYMHDVRERARVIN